MFGSICARTFIVPVLAVRDHMSAGTTGIAKHGKGVHDDAARVIRRLRDGQSGKPPLPNARAPAPRFLVHSEFVRVLNHSSRRPPELPMAALALQSTAWLRPQLQTMDSAGMAPCCASAHAKVCTGTPKRHRSAYHRQKAFFRCAGVSHQCGYSEHTRLHRQRSSAYGRSHNPPCNLPGPHCERHDLL